MMNYGNGWVYKNSEGGYEIAYQYFTRIKVLKKALSNVPQKHSSSTKMILNRI
jgi:hypothetical protein